METVHKNVIFIRALYKYRIHSLSLILTYTLKKKKIMWRPQGWAVTWSTASTHAYCCIYTFFQRCSNISLDANVRNKIGITSSQI